MLFETLNESHTSQLLSFELENRAFFESFIAPREPSFYSLAGVCEHIESLLSLKRQSLARSFVLVKSGNIVARANIKEIQSNSTADIGYRVGKRFLGKGIGSSCVNFLVSAGIDLALEQLSAFVINNNPASQKVLLNNGFQLSLCIPNGFVHQGKAFHGFQYLRALA